MRISRSVTQLLFSLALLGGSAPAFAQISISINIAPPALPVYEQPEIPDDGYIWTPGYWAYGDEGYFWVPGTWVQPPNPGLLWTPGYWGWQDGIYAFNAGYWGPHVGYYGGINYGYGYGGNGYEGGRWDNGHFAYNRTVNNINNTHITNIYNQTVIVNNSSHVAYNGGNGGTTVRESEAERNVAREQHVQATSVQTQQQQTARADRNQLASVNHGRPPVAATMRPAEFSGKNIVPAKAAGEPYRPEAAKPAAEHPAEHPAGQPGPNGTRRPEAVEAHPETSEARPAAVAQPHPMAEQHPAAEPHAIAEQHRAAEPRPEEARPVERPNPVSEPHPPATHSEAAHPAEHPSPAAAPHPAAPQPPHPAEHPAAPQHPAQKPGEPDKKE